MCLLIETIKIKNRQFENLVFHQERLNKARIELFGSNDIIAISDIEIPKNISENIYKCRIIYDKIIRTVEFISYTIRKIQSLQLVHDNEIEYAHKFENRQKIKKLYSKREELDDILIIKNGYITDTSYGNIVFFDGKNWITPNTPLLAGTKRNKLLSENKINEKTIHYSNINLFEKACVINAFLDLNNKYTTFSVENIKN